MALQHVVWSQSSPLLEQLPPDDPLTSALELGEESSPDVAMSVLAVEEAKVVVATVLCDPFEQILPPVPYPGTHLASALQHDIGSHCSPDAAQVPPTTLLAPPVSAGAPPDVPSDDAPTVGGWVDDCPFDGWVDTDPSEDWVDIVPSDDGWVDDAPPDVGLVDADPSDDGWADVEPSDDCWVEDDPSEVDTPVVFMPDMGTLVEPESEVVKVGTVVLVVALD
jgi:hypothetical protein